MARLREAGSIAGIKDWREIAPDKHHDWIRQRDEAWQTLLQIGSKEAKSGRADDAIFGLFCLGYKTGRDAYIYNFSRTACAENARRMAEGYAAALCELERTGGDPEEISRRHAAHVRWDSELRNNLRQRKAAAAHSPARVWRTQYRPFVKQHCYVDYVLVSSKYQQDSIFPSAAAPNRAICVPGKSAKKPFSVLMADAMPDLNLNEAGAQCFPRWRYRAPADAQGDLPGTARRLERVDNISDAALRAFRAHYGEGTITKDDVFDYVYGVLHAADFRARFANDLAKDLPRTPFAPDFRAFADAGGALAALHLGYETCPEYPLEVVFSGEARDAHYRIGSRAMRFADKEERTTLIVNEHIRLAGVPAAAHRYAVNGRTPLEWLIDRYRIKQDKESGIVNDPNDWFDDPRDLIAALRRAVHLGVETARITDALPPALGPA